MRDDSTDETPPLSIELPAWMKAVYIGAGAITVLLLVLHTFWPGRFEVDSTSLGLVALLVILPIANRITKLKFGGLEAEIAHRAARQLRLADQQLAEYGKAANATQIVAVPPDPAVLASVDEPSKLLAIDRLRLEQAVRDMAEANGLDVGRMTLMKVTKLLMDRGVLASSVGAATLEVTRVLNAGAHNRIDDWGIALDAHDTVERIVQVLDATRP